MKAPIHPHRTRLYTRIILPALITALWIPAQSNAANVYWDPIAGNNLLDAGGGSWNANTSNTVWTSSTTSATNTYWTSGPGVTAVFGGAAADPSTYSINVASTGIQALSIRFISTGYVLTGAIPTTISLGYGGVSGSGLSVGTGVTANIGDGITIVSGTAGSQPLTLTGTGTINVSSSSASAPATLKAGINNNTSLSGGITVVVGNNGVLQSALTTNGGTTNGSIVVGSDAGNATLTVNGGTANFQNLVLGNTTATGISTVNIESGVVAGAANNSFIRFGQSSGSATTSGTSIINLDGGTLSIGSITVGATGGVAAYNVNFNGGALKATQSTTSFMAASSQLTTKVLAGGAVFDTNGFNITVAQALTSGTTNDGGLTKQGTGTLSLTGVNTYTGATAIKSGSLALGASSNISNTLVLGGVGGLTGTLDVTLKGLGANYAQTNISGNGTILTNAGTVTASGLVTPGFSAGLLTVTGNFTLAGTASTQMEIAGNGGVAGTDFDYIDVSGVLAYGGALTISGYNGYDLTQTGTYDLFGFTSNSGDFTSVTVNSISLTKSGEIWSSSQFTFDESNGAFTVNAVPEPSTYALLVGGLGMLGLLRRKMLA
jgi:hypothetical protein